MQPLASLIVLVLLSSSWAMPVDDEDRVIVGGVQSKTAALLEKRQGTNDGSSYENAKDVHLDAAGWEDCANADAWAILCAGAPQTLQRLVERDPDLRDKARAAHYRKSGASARPFRSDNLSKFSLKRPEFSSSQEEWRSTEEFPYESANVLNEIGRKVYLFPVPESNQRSQSGKLGGSLKHHNVDYGQWYHIVHFDNCPRTYCKAFNDNDISVCDEKLKAKEEVDPREYAAVRISNFGQRYEFGFAGGKGITKRRDVVEDLDADDVMDDGTIDIIS